MGEGSYKAVAKRVSFTSTREPRRLQYRQHARLLPTPLPRRRLALRLVLPFPGIITVLVPCLLLSSRQPTKGPPPTHTPSATASCVHRLRPLPLLPRRPRPIRPPHPSPDNHRAAAHRPRRPHLPQPARLPETSPCRKTVVTRLAPGIYLEMAHGHSPPSKG